MRKPDTRIIKLPVERVPTRALRLVARPLFRLAEKLLAFPRLEKIYRLAQGLDPATPFAQRVMSAMDLRLEFNPEHLEKIPETGAVLLVANHPYGGIEGVALQMLLKQVRPDAKIMANFLLGIIPEMRGDFILVDPFGGPSAKRNNLRGMREALAWLKEGHLLAVFPAGEVSSFQWRANHVTDIPWPDSVAALARKTRATVTPLYFAGRNPTYFNVAGFIHPRLRTALLPRQVVNKEGKKIHVEIGSPIHEKDWLPFAESDASLIRYLRFRTYLLAGRMTRRQRMIPFIPRGPMLPQDPIIPPLPPEKLAEEIAALPFTAKLLEAGDCAVYIAESREIPRVLREIGRLREIAFRAVGEGTGNEADIDQFDSYYQHLFIWNAARQEVIGSYRLGMTDAIINAYRASGLYTHTLFRFGDEFLNAISPAIELGRSFIRPEYQRSLAGLPLLWKGISAFLARTPKYRYLFGPVSITHEYRDASRWIMLETLRKHKTSAALSALVTPRRPPKPPRRIEWCRRENAAYFTGYETMCALVSEIEPDGKDIPVLLRQYLRLEGEIAAFNVDPDFSSVVDGLIVIDLHKLPHRVLRKYMGADSADTYARARGLPVDPPTITGETQK